MAEKRKILANPLFLSLVAYIVAFCGIEALVRYIRVDTTSFALDCAIVVLVYVLPGLVIIIIAAMARALKFTWKIPTKTLEWSVFALLGQIIINLGAVIISGFVGANSVSKIEQFFFEVACGGGEEMAFRVLPIFGLALVAAVIYRSKKATWRRRAWKGAGLVIGAAWFAAAHYWDPVAFLTTGQLEPGVYYTTPILIGGLFIVGLWLGICMLACNDPTAPLFAHVVYDVLTNLKLVI